MDLEKVKALIKILESSNLKKRSVKEGDFEVCLEKEMEKLHYVEKTTLVQKEIDTKQEEQNTTDQFISSPMIGTFYSRPSPDKEPFVKNGDKVQKDTIVCIIEAMKVMNEVKAGINGIIVELLVQDTQPVEFGSKLFRIDPL